MPGRILTSRLLLTGILAVTFGSSSARADLLLTKDGRTIACRILKSEDTVLRVLTGDPAGPRELTIELADITEHLQGIEEIARIEASKDAERLVNWCAAYYQAGYETLARRAMRRALSLDRKLGDTPLVGRPDSTSKRSAATTTFARFRNLITIRDRVTALAPDDAAGLLSAARWAHRAGLKDEAARLLRRAWRVDATQSDISSLALAWGVHLEGWMTIDLTPALDGSLFTDTLRDDETLVAADPEMEFLLLPLRYEPDRLSKPAAGESEVRNLSRNSFKGRDARGFYGFLPATIRDGSFRPASDLRGPVYERFLLKTGEGGRTLAELRNHLGPRTPEAPAADKRRTGRSARQPRIKTTVATERANGSLIAVFEVAKNASEMKIEWADGGEETVDLDFLRQASIVSPDRVVENLPDTPDARRKKNWPWSATPAVTRALRLAEGSSPAMAALAIERLARIRRQLEIRFDPDARASLNRWANVVDPTMLRAGGRAEEQIQLAVWKYFCERIDKSDPSPSPLALSMLTEAEADLQLSWVRITACALRLEQASHWWRRVCQRPLEITSEEDQTRLGGGGPVPSPCAYCAARLLEAVLASEDSFVCSEAIDILLALPPAVTDWKFLEYASASAQRYALTRIGELSDRASAARLLQALILAARPEMAQEVARAAQSLELNAQDIEAAILSQWWSLDVPSSRTAAQETSRKTAFLRVLQGINLGDSVYGKRFARMMEDALKGTQQERIAAWQLLITQLMYRREHLGVECSVHRGSDGVGDKRSINHGPFPLMVDPASHDPLLRGITDAAREGPVELRPAALSVLLETGYADETAQCLLAPGLDPAARNHLLNDLLHSSRLYYLDATVALAGHLLQPRCFELAETIMNYLDRRAAEYTPEEAWRLSAALKAGVHIEQMEALVNRAPAPVAARIRQWIFRICHMSPQDQQRLASARSVEERADRLARINLRRGQIVDGTYGVLAIAVTTTQTKIRATDMQGPSPMTGRWITPRRLTLALPPIRISFSDDDDDEYEILWQDKIIGQGRIPHEAMPIRGPRAYYPVLRASPVWWSLAGFLAPGIDPETRDEGASGPLRLPSLKVLTPPAPGTMTITITDLLRKGLADAGAFPDVDLTELVPDDFRITLRYGAFGAFSGCGSELFPGIPTGDMLGGPDDELPAKRRQLLNVMLVLERTDW